MYSLAELQQRYLQFAQSARFRQHQPRGLYEPIDYILDLGGKAMRPALVLLGANLFSDEIDPALSAAHGIELFHNFSLMHDDIMDAAPLRRGEATVHTRFGTNTAILSGDAMLVYAFQYVCQCAPEFLPSVVSIFNRVAIGVCEGQQLDMDFEKTWAVSVEDYVEMIRLKTAVLLQGALEIGACLAGANVDAQRVLGEFGVQMGLAFQLKDDWLDTFGQSAKVGKRIGGDILQNKKTYLVLRSLEVASEADRAELLRWLSANVPAEQETAKIEAVRAIFDRCGASQALLDRVEEHYSRALAALDSLALPDTSRAEALKGFLRFIMDREH